MLKKIIYVILSFGATIAQAFAPQAGGWAVNAEFDGRPGRGMTIDVQNDTIALQVFAYESNGQATFYLGAGRLGSDGKANLSLMRYSGGRFFGSAPRSAQEIGGAGVAMVRFTSGVDGFITFPGESEKAISRFNFGYAAVPESLRGIWTLNSIGSEGLQSDLVELVVNQGATTNGNGLVANTSDTFGCEHQLRGDLSGKVLCVKINSRGQLLRSYIFVYSVNEGEGFSSASATSTQQLLSIRRLTTPKGIGTGLVVKSNEQGVNNSSALLQHIDKISNFGFSQ